MAEESAKLRIPYIAAAQAQKHVTHNEAMTLLDTLVQLSVLDKDLATPPGSPEEGDTYIVAASATGAWISWDGRIARYIDGTWRSYLPGEGGGAGWLAYVIDEATLYVFSGTTWEELFIAGGSGSGDVTTAGAVTAGHLARYANGTGDVLEDAGVALSALAPLASPSFTGTPAAPTASPGTNTTQIATTAFVAAAVAALIASAPGALDTLDELAAALGDDANFAASVTTALAGKQAAHANLTAFAGLSLVADKLPYANGTGTLALADFTSFGRSLVDDANAADAAATLGLGTGDTPNFAGLVLGSSGSLAWTTDLFLRRKAAANLVLGAADAASPIAQTLSVQNVAAGTSNTAGAAFTINGSASTGNANGGNLNLGVSEPGSSGTSQNAASIILSVVARTNQSVAGVIPGTNNAFDLGDTAKSWRRGWFSDDVRVGSISQVSGGFSLVAFGGSRLDLGGSGGGRIYGDAPGVLALRSPDGNHGNASTLHIYRTFTDASNYERVALQAGSGYVEVAAETAGTGSDDLDLRLTPAGAGRVRFGTHSALGAETVTGYITVKDAAGTSRKLAVVS